MPSKEFEAAATAAKSLPSKPSNETLLEIYSLYKQATVGDCNVKRPDGMFEYTDKAKWDAWNGKKGLSQEEAEKQYIALINKLSQ
ncbi:hypothetical protein BGZ50_004960 [Haplosporangium sp. Z 11]|nr:hypothetical protein BGZ50_004960 [Haplosporangium sp. Z 11]